MCIEFYLKELNEILSQINITLGKTYNKPKIWTKNSKNSEFAVL